MEDNQEIPTFYLIYAQETESREQEETGRIRRGKKRVEAIVTGDYGKSPERVFGMAMGLGMAFLRPSFSHGAWRMFPEEVPEHIAEMDKKKSKILKTSWMDKPYKAFLVKEAKKAQRMEEAAWDHRRAA